MIRQAKKEDNARISEILVYTKRVTYRDIFKNDDFTFNKLQVVETFNQLEVSNLDSIIVFDDGIIKAFLRCDNLLIAQRYIMQKKYTHG